MSPPAGRAPQSPTPSSTSSSHRRVVVADDVPGTVLFLSRALTKRGFDVRTAEDGEQCLNLIRAFQPELVILDIMMPKVHGVDVLKAVRADETLKDVGFIVCSARSFTVDLKQVRDLGAFDFLDKPFELRQVMEKVDAFFEGRPPPRRPSAAATATARASDAEIFRPTLDPSRGYWRLWGTRGSIPVSGPRVARHGGNTACLEVRAGDDLCVIDAGSGVRDLGLQLMKEGPRNVPLLIGHTHWDHIQGFPFFTPAYVPGFTLDVYGASGFGKDLQSIFRGQLDRDYFPVEMQDMAARLEFRHLRENPLVFGKVQVYWEMMNHPGATVGFRIELDGTRVAYVTDNEFLKGYLGPPFQLAASSELVVPYERIIQFVSGCDVLIMEAQYTNEEYAKKVGWGHSALSNACVLVKLAGVRRWVVTHHDPMHDDEFLLGKLDLTRQLLRSMDCPTEVVNGYDGMTEYL